MNTLSPIGAFLRWWKEELAGLLPAGTWSDEPGQPRSQIVIAIDREPAQILLEGDRKRTTTGDAMPEGAELSTALARVLATHPALPVTVRVGAEQCFRRERQLPARARKEFDRILALEMERSTPFKSGEVMTAYVVSPSSAKADHLNVEHFILKSRLVEPALDQARALGRSVDRIDCWTDDRSSARAINFLATAQQSGAVSWSFGKVAAWAVPGLVVLAVAQVAWTQSAALGDLQRSVEAAQAEARAVHRALDEASSIAAEVAGVRKLVEARQPATAIIDAVTKLLPDGVWLETLRIDGESLELAGLAPKAAALLPLFERSAFFYDARFNDPVRLDADQVHERFNLRARIKPVAGEASSLPTQVKGQGR